MSELNQIQGLSEASLQLLEASGIDTIAELAALDAGHLVAELNLANETLSLLKRLPDKADVSHWITQAMAIVGAEPTADTPPEIEPAVNFEANPEVAEMLARAPCAIPLPGEIMMGKGLRVSDVPAGILLNRYSGDLDVRIGSSTPPKPELPTRRKSSDLESFSKSLPSQVFTSIAAQPATPAKEKGTRVPGSKSGHEEDRIALIRAPRAETNLGKDPDSRQFIRGVLHTHPWHLRFGAVFSLLLLANLPLAVASAFLLLASEEKPEIFAWVPQWSIAFPIALPITGLGYLLWGLTGKCRICNQKLFTRKGALKHVKAHRIPGMGFVFPLCLHLLAFNWFRCSSCGTPVRLKK
jgi:hypothetical protein